ncbi:MAG TPA: DJ-1/PfpI family protein [Myxococcota bacterium]|jgi:putative intracellular protease/amidase|nr:DJ-1/PfpI family protein [Myxococcota bacterium]
MKIAFALYEGFTLLDIVGPFQVLSALPGVEAAFVGQRRGGVRDHTGVTALEATRSFDDFRDPDVIVVPGGIGTMKVVERKDPVIDWIGAVHPATTWTTSVCTGSLLLGAAGVLQGLEATCHWALLDRLTGFGAKPTPSRVVFQDRIVTAAGVSSGIDMALALAARMQGDTIAQAIQLAIEYDPQPPFDAGSPAKAPAAAVEIVRSLGLE